MFVRFECGVKILQIIKYCLTKEHMKEISWNCFNDLIIKNNDMSKEDEKMNGDQDLYLFLGSPFLIYISTVVIFYENKAFNFSS